MSLYDQPAYTPLSIAIPIIPALSATSRDQTLSFRSATPDHSVADSGFGSSAPREKKFRHVLREHNENDTGTSARSLNELMRDIDAYGERIWIHHRRISRLLSCVHWLHSTLLNLDGVEQQWATWIGRLDLFVRKVHRKLREWYSLGHVGCLASAEAIQEDIDDMQVTAQHMGVSKHPTIMQELATRALNGDALDAEDLTRSLIHIVADEDLRAKALLLRATPADNFMNRLVRALDSTPTPATQEVTFPDTFPSQTTSLLHAMMLENVTLPSAMSSGDLSDRGSKVLIFGRHFEIWAATSSNRALALKVPRKPLAIAGSDMDLDIFRRLAHHALLLLPTSIHHPHILEFLGMNAQYSPRLAQEIQIPAMVTPWATNGTVAEYVKSRDDVNRIRLMAEVAGALGYLHAKGVVHGAVRCENILISEAGQTQLTGFSRAHSSSRTNASEDIDSLYSRTTLSIVRDGFVRWSSPRLLSFSSQETEGDRWSFGMTMLELFTESKPWFETVLDESVAMDILGLVTPKWMDHQRPLWRKRGMGRDVWGVIESCWVSVSTAESVSVVDVMSEIAMTLERMGRDWDFGGRDAAVREAEVLGDVSGVGTRLDDVPTTDRPGLTPRIVPRAVPSAYVVAYQTPQSDARTPFFPYGLRAGAGPTPVHIPLPLSPSPSAFGLKSERAASPENQPSRFNFLGTPDPSRFRFDGGASTAAGVPLPESTFAFTGRHTAADLPLPSSSFTAAGVPLPSSTDPSRFRFDGGGGASTAGIQVLESTDHARFGLRGYEFTPARVPLPDSTMTDPSRFGMTGHLTTAAGVPLPASPNPSRFAFTGRYTAADLPLPSSTDPSRFAFTGRYTAADLPLPSSTDPSRFGMTGHLTTAAGIPLPISPAFSRLGLGEHPTPAGVPLPTSPDPSRFGAAYASTTTAAPVASPAPSRFGMGVATPAGVPLPMSPAPSRFQYDAGSTLGVGLGGAFGAGPGLMGSTHTPSRVPLPMSPSMSERPISPGTQSRGDFARSPVSALNEVRGRATSPWRAPTVDTGPLSPMTPIVPIVIPPSPAVTGQSRSRFAHVATEIRLTEADAHHVAGHLGTGKASIEEEFGVIIEMFTKDELEPEYQGMNALWKIKGPESHVENAIREIMTRVRRVIPVDLSVSETIHIAHKIWAERHAAITEAWEQLSVRFVVAISAGTSYWNSGLEESVVDIVISGKRQDVASATAELKKMIDFHTRFNHAVEIVKHRSLDARIQSRGRGWLYEISNSFNVDFEIDDEKGLIFVRGPPAGLEDAKRAFLSHFGLADRRKRETLRTHEVWHKLVKKSQGFVLRIVLPELVRLGVSLESLDGPIPGVGLERPFVNTRPIPDEHDLFRPEGTLWQVRQNVQEPGEGELLWRLSAAQDQHAQLMAASETLKYTIGRATHVGFLTLPEVDRNRLDTLTEERVDQLSIQEGCDIIIPKREDLWHCTIVMIGPREALEAARARMLEICHNYI